MQNLESGYIVGGNAHCAATMRNSIDFLQKLKIEQPCYLATPFLDMYLKQLKSGYLSGSIFMFLAAIFTIVKTWKQTTCLGKDGWTHKIW